LVSKYELNKVIVESCFIHTKNINDFEIVLCNPLSWKSIGTNESAGSIKNQMNSLKTAE